MQSMLKKEKILKEIRKVDRDTFLGLVEIHDNTIFHASRCKKCTDDLVICPNRVKHPKDFKNNNDYTSSMVEWIQGSTEDLDSFFFKKKNFIQCSSNYK